MNIFSRRKWNSGDALERSWRRGVVEAGAASGLDLKPVVEFKSRKFSVNIQSRSFAEPLQQASYSAARSTHAILRSMYGIKEIRNHCTICP